MGLLHIGKSFAKAGTGWGFFLEGREKVGCSAGWMCTVRGQCGLFGGFLGGEGECDFRDSFLNVSGTFGFYGILVHVKVSVLRVLCYHSCVHSHATSRSIANRNLDMWLGVSNMHASSSVRSSWYTVMIISSFFFTGMAFFTGRA